ncbi:histidine phosphatase family protein [Paenibacillus polymyxa]|uniref:Histidine phosphatase family protein n=1 Tax=Paenibacillus polymyxa TaxID=1406 RepID=A0AAE9IAR9_PAEPO|nr:histidine phosphatase family protein [Paenibacillus polymyxa]URJ50989.1 histidine phosphatase family protein [Paenibacillus polymyxa]
MSQTEMQYEIKFLLDGNQVLTDEHELRVDLVHLDQAALQQLDIRFLDTSALDLYHAGWILRGRLKQNKDQWEITYKKRVDLFEGRNIEQAIKVLEESGFDLNDPSWSKEVDWSGEHQTLNLSYEVKVNVSELHHPDDWKAIFLKHAPDPLRRQQWGDLNFTTMLAKTSLFGPITAHKYKGEWGGIQENVEVWNVAGSSIVEITTEATGSIAAQSSRDLMETLLQQQDLLPLQPGMSKTDWALNKFLHSEDSVVDPFALLRQGGYNLYFRHAQPENTVDNDVMLSVLGRKQAWRLGELLTARKIPIQFPVSTSPINRARQTAEIAFSQQNIKIEPRLLKRELDQLLETAPEEGVNQIFVAHHHNFNNQLQLNKKFDYLNMVLLKPLGRGKGYKVVQVLNLLQEALIKYSSTVSEGTIR